MTSHVIAYRSKELLFGTHAFNFNCILDNFNCVFKQIRCLSVLLMNGFKVYPKLFTSYCHLLINFANSLDPDQAQSVRPDLDPN